MKNSIFNNLLVRAIFLGCLYLTSCGPSPETYGDCSWDPTGRDCNAISFSIVDDETYENLIGTRGQPIHPDSIIIYNTRGDEMPISIEKRKHPHMEHGWYTNEHLSPYDELYCFNMCTNDSSFTRTYYMYLGNGDTDTIEIYFPAKTNPFKVLFNGSLDRALHSGEDSGLDSALWFTSHWFLKELN